MWNLLARIQLYSPIKLVASYPEAWLDRKGSEEYGASVATRGEEHLCPAKKQHHKQSAAEELVWLQDKLILVEEHEGHISEPKETTPRSTSSRHFCNDNFLLGLELLQFGY